MFNGKTSVCVAYVQTVGENANMKVAVMGPFQSVDPDACWTAIKRIAAADALIREDNALNSNAGLAFCNSLNAEPYRTTNVGYPGGCGTDDPHAAAASSPASPPVIVGDIVAMYNASTDAKHISAGRHATATPPATAAVAFVVARLATTTAPTAPAA